ncbi:MAG TPA: dipeptidase [Blastocatellia bacterium]|nr:dipeptidase [Blastocatellia bacterium]
MLTSILRRSAVLCLALSLGADVLAAGGAPLSPQNYNQTHKNGSRKETVKQGATAASKAQDDAALRARANRLHRQSIVIDTHNDITSPLMDDGFDLAMRGDDPSAKIKTHTDLRRMKAGGVGAEFFAVYVGKEFVNKKPGEGGGAARRALDVIDVVLEQVRRHPESLETASTAADIRRIVKSGKIATLMGIEGGHAIEDSLHTLRMFYKLGVRYMTLTHTNTNDWADSEGDINNSSVNHHNGLTDFGREVVREMNRIGMMIDISHVADKTFYDVIATTRAPVIASHSSARALANHPRNMSDDMLRALAKNGGVVMVNFYDGFLDPRKAELALRERTMDDELKAKYPNDPKRAQEEIAAWRKANDPGKTALSVLMDHIDHIAKVAGIDHLGIGSDFDGVPLTGLPEGMEDISKLPTLTYELMKRGYSDVDIKKILGENLLRVMAQVERVAIEMQSNSSKKK